MKKINNSLRSAIIIAIVFFGQMANAQDSTKQAPKRPNINVNVKLTSNQDINNFVAQSFGMYANVEDLSQKIQAIQNEIISGTATGGLSQSLANLNDAMNGFQLIKTSGPALVTSVTTIIANIKDYHISLFEIPRALLNLREALKAIKYSVESSIYLLTFTADLKSKIGGSRTAPVNSTPATTAQKATTGSTEQTERILTTIITLKGVSFAKLQQLEDALKTNPLIKSTNKKFSAGIATLNITNTCSLSQLWEFCSAHCKDIANADNLTAWDETNNRIDIAMK